MESVDEIEIKGESIPERLDNEYIEETEVVETTADNLRSGLLKKPLLMNNRKNLDNIGRHIINEYIFNFLRH